MFYSQADRVAIPSPIVYENISIASTYSLVCPYDEGTDMFVRCTVDYTGGSNMIGVFTYDGNIEEIEIPLGRVIFI